MTTVTLFDNNQACLMYHPDTQIVHHMFRKNLDSKNLHLVLDGGIDLLKKNHAKKWLSDNREMDPHSEEDGIWVNENWLPRAVAAGWKYWALVVPDDFIARLNMSEFVEFFYERGVRIMVFTEIDSAVQWLDNVDKQ